MGSISAPTWLQKASQNRPKIDQKSIPRASYVRLVLGSTEQLDLERFWLHFGPKLGPQNLMCVGVFSSNLALASLSSFSKINKPCETSPPKCNVRWAFLAQIWHLLLYLTFEPILGPSWGYLGPSWDHLGAILGHLGAILGPGWGSLGLS